MIEIKSEKSIGKLEMVWLLQSHIRSSTSETFAIVDSQFSKTFSSFLFDRKFIKDSYFVETIEIFCVIKRLGTLNEGFYKD